MPQPMSATNFDSVAFPVPENALRRSYFWRLTMRTRFARLSLPAKILFSTSCSVTLLFAITVAIVWGNINRSCENAAGLTPTILVLLLAATCGALALTYLVGRHILEPLDRLDRAVADGEDQ